MLDPETQETLDRQSPATTAAKKKAKAKKPAKKAKKKPLKRPAKKVKKPAKAASREPQRNARLDVRLTSAERKKLEAHGKKKGMKITAVVASLIAKIK